MRRTLARSDDLNVGPVSKPEKERLSVPTDKNGVTLQNGDRVKVTFPDGESELGTVCVDFGFDNLEEIYPEAVERGIVLVTDSKGNVEERLAHNLQKLEDVKHGDFVLCQYPERQGWCVGWVHIDDIPEKEDLQELGLVMLHYATPPDDMDSVKKEWLYKLNIQPEEPEFVEGAQ